MTDAIKFDIKADDALAAPIPTTQYALVKKSSGYLYPFGLGLPALAAASAYASKFDDGRIIVSREVGTVDWLIVNAPESTVPDTLPDDFA